MNGTTFWSVIKCFNEEELRGSDELEEQLRLWASYRGQALTRTVRGMMYYRKALELQAFLDMAKDDGKGGDGIHYCGSRVLFIWTFTNVARNNPAIGTCTVM